jgi:guanidinobutyrase / D-arginase
MMARLARNDGKGQSRDGEGDVVGPVDSLKVPRFAGPATFARLPRLDQVDRCDAAIVGVPFDSGTTYRPGARFGPMAIRQASRLLRAYHPGLDVEPFGAQQVADAGDISANPFDISEAIRQTEEGAAELLRSVSHLVTFGGDHTIALPLLRAVKEKFGPVALLHLDAHLDTWDTYFGAAYTHGTPFRRAWEEGLLLQDQAVHVGIRGPLYAREDLGEDERFGFAIVSAMDLESIGVAGAVERVRDRLGDAPVYVSVDIDVIDPGLAPGTGTPEAGGLLTREVLGILRGLAGLRIESADIVEVSPAYDHGETTSIAASHIAYELLGLLGRGAA